MSGSAVDLTEGLPPLPAVKSHLSRLPPAVVRNPHPGVEWVYWPPEEPKTQTVFLPDCLAL